VTDCPPSPPAKPGGEGRETSSRREGDDAVSIILPVYNGAATLADAARSVLAQTHPRLELLILDDGSEDDSFAVARTFRRDPRVRLFRVPHLGQAGIKNHGILHSRYPLVAFLDADDLWRPTKLERQLALLRDRPDVDLVFARRVFLRGEELVEDRSPPPPRGDVLAHLFRDNFICFSSVLIRRRALDYAGIFSPELSLAIDYELWLRLAAHGKFDYVDEPLVVYRTGHENLSARTLDRLATALTVMDRFVNDRGGRERLPAPVIRQAYRQTFRSFALASAPFSARRQWHWLGRLLRSGPLPPGDLLFVVKAVVKSLLALAGWRRRGWEACYSHPANRPENW
jgi:glycosyltransferase involved in cell wall biosynthesis